MRDFTDRLKLPNKPQGNEVVDVARGAVAAGRLRAEPEADIASLHTAVDPILDT